MKVGAEEVRVGDRLARKEAMTSKRKVVKIKRKKRFMKYTLSGGYTVYSYHDDLVELEPLKEPADDTERPVRADQLRVGDRLVSGQSIARRGADVTKVKNKKKATKLTFDDGKAAHLFNDSVVTIER